MTLRRRVRCSAHPDQRHERFDIARKHRARGIPIDEVKEDIRALALQFLLDLPHRRFIRATRIEQRNVAMLAYTRVVPAEHLHEHVAQIARLRGREERRDDFLERELVRTGENKPRRTLFQKQLLHRRQLFQHRLLDRLRQLAEKALEPLDDVEKKRLVHTRSSSQLRSFRANARSHQRRRRKSFSLPRAPTYRRGMSLNVEVLSRAANEARGLAMDAVHASKSGHLGLPLGCAEIGAVLYGHELRYNPEQPRWIGRDYFILSAGHGSMMLYAWLHLSGHDVSMDDIRNFRQLHSKTPGHPEFFETPGVECTTGPLGQGVGNAVGVAMAAKMAAARFNTPEHKIFDQHVICLAGDGCLQEGVSAEASAFAGAFRPR